jgi:outer membrane scaffolding protein for murein synthesis (MipA/OmpV family)
MVFPGDAITDSPMVGASRTQSLSAGFMYNF